VKFLINLYLLLLTTQWSSAEKVYATAYTSTTSQTDNTPCISASGKNICRLYKRGIRTIAVSRDLRRRYPYGSVVIIEGKRYRVEDTMNRRYKHRIDIYFGKDHKKAYRWKNRVVQIRMVNSKKCRVKRKGGERCK